jgi:outer membrane protein insertion porin family
MRCRLVFVFVASLFLSLAGPLLVPQVALSIAQAETISSIVVEGNQRVEVDTVLSYVQISPGESVDPDKIDASVKALFQTGLFSDVQIARRGGTLVVRVEENPMVNQVNFEGNKEVKDTDLAKEVELRERMMFTRAKVLSDVNRVIAVYRRAGYYSVKVSPKVIRLPQNRVDLVFEIQEGDETKVKRLEFVGNKAFSANTLKGVVGTQEYTWWGSSTATTITMPTDSNMTRSCCGVTICATALPTFGSCLPMRYSRPMALVSRSPTRSRKGRATRWRMWQSMLATPSLKPTFWSTR